MKLRVEDFLKLANIGYSPSPLSTVNIIKLTTLSICVYYILLPAFYNIQTALNTQNYISFRLTGTRPVIRTIKLSNDLIWIGNDLDDVLLHTKFCVFRHEGWFYLIDHRTRGRWGAVNQSTDIN